MYQLPVHQSEGLPEGSSTGILVEEDSHGARGESRYEPLRRPWTSLNKAPPLAGSYNPRNTYYYLEGASNGLNMTMGTYKSFFAMFRWKLRNELMMLS